MKKLRKIGAFLLALTMVLGMAAPTLPAKAAETPTISLKADAEQVNSGKTVNVNVNIDQNIQDAGTFELNVYYDASRFTLDTANSKKGVNCGPASVSVSKDFTDSDGNHYYKIMGINLDVANPKFDITAGTIYTLAFKAKTVGSVQDAKFTLKNEVFEDKDSTPLTINVADQLTVSVAPPAEYTVDFQKEFFVETQL